MYKTHKYVNYRVHNYISGNAEILGSHKTTADNANTWGSLSLLTRRWLTWQLQEQSNDRWEVPTWRLKSGGEDIFGGKVWMVLVQRGWLLLAEEYGFSFGTHFVWWSAESLRCSIATM